MQKELHRLKDIMNGRQRACDAKLQDMKHELEGAQLAADKRVEEVVAKCDAEIQKCKVCINYSFLMSTTVSCKHKYSQSFDFCNLAICAKERPFKILHLGIGMMRTASSRHGVDVQ